MVGRSRHPFLEAPLSTLDLWAAVDSNVWWGCRVFWGSLLATPAQISQTDEWPVTPICSVTKCFSTWTSICSRFFLSPFHYAILRIQNRRLPEEIDFSDGMEFARYPFPERFDFSDMYRFPGFWPGELLDCPYISVEKRYRDIQRITKGQNSKRDQNPLCSFSLVLMVFVLNLNFLMTVALPYAYFSWYLLWATECFSSHWKRRCNEDIGLLGCHAVLQGQEFPGFRRNIPLYSLRAKQAFISMYVPQKHQ